MTQHPESVRAPDALAALRSATASRHEELDSGLPIGAPDASLDDYAGHLAMLRAWLAPLQDWLAGFADDPRFDQASRLALIERDLDEQGMPPVLAPASSADAVWPPDASPAWRWGVCYVIEGSQLGGAVLYQRLHERLAPHPLRYLKGIDAGPGPRWRAFMLALREHVRTPEEIEEACAGACAAFDGMLALRGRLCPR
ncbi:heme oxygenase [Massilia sp. WF1]|uniref:biliverdin-producing heme oxygenase n=1 Tax=unclassified Massilia TaxID=2609279 RepID=UPI00064B4773|nr:MULTISPECIES: biliverdin-producing heme oxygenase [unclassified Massilia]ALK98500.1 heme oxygenase [Massilia sp. WG5]KLU37586.1 heme oxygenase [Massilia sp. WF1]